MIDDLMTIFYYMLCSSDKILLAMAIGTALGCLSSISQSLGEIRNLLKKQLEKDS